jgi:hypothetical protein
LAVSPQIFEEINHYDQSHYTAEPRVGKKQIEFNSRPDSEYLFWKMVDVVQFRQSERQRPTENKYSSKYPGRSDEMPDQDDDGATKRPFPPGSRIHR